MSLASGNTFGAQQWSDANMYAPHLPRISDVQKCPHCGKFFMYADAQKRFDDSDFCVDTGNLSYHELKQAFLLLEDMVKGSKSELALRMAFLHGFNEAFRDYVKNSWEKDEGVEDDKLRNETDYNLHRSNLSAMLQLLDRSTNEDLPFIAEVYRELGRFDECIAVLEDFETDNNFMRMIAENIREKALAKDDKVFEIDYSKEQGAIIL